MSEEHIELTAEVRCGRTSCTDCQMRCWYYRQERERRRVLGLEQSLAASQPREAAKDEVLRECCGVVECDSRYPKCQTPTCPIFRVLKDPSPAYDEWKAMRAVCEAAKEWCNLKDTQRLLENDEETEENLSDYREVSAKIFLAYKRLRDALAALEEVKQGE